MVTKKFIHRYLRTRNNRILLLLFTILFSVFYVFIPQAIPAYAEATPGGDISNPVVQAVDIAKPSVVRILTTLGGRITITLPDQSMATFPLNGSTYTMQISGSGTFISSHGDILTADHVIRPPHNQSMDQNVQSLAAQDIANYLSQIYPSASTPYTANEIAANLAYGILPSKITYTAPKSEVYLSQDYTGSYLAKSLSTIPSYVHATVNKIEAESTPDQRDIAIVHVNMTDTPSVQLADSSNVSQQDELTIIGYPGNGDLGTSENSNPSSFLASSVNKIYVSSLKIENNGVPVIQVGGNIEHGDSGGPALDSKGDIVGIVSFSSVDSNPPIGTSFLQTSDSATQLLSHTSINTTQGPFQEAWQHAFADYTSKAPGHWRAALQDFQQIQTTYTQFGAITPFLSYAQQQSATETPSQMTSNTYHLFIMLSILITLLFIYFLAFIIWHMITRRPTSHVSYQSSYQGEIPYYPPAFDFDRQAVFTPYTPQPTPTLWQSPDAKTTRTALPDIPEGEIIDSTLSDEDVKQTLQNIHWPENTWQPDQFLLTPHVSISPTNTHEESTTHQTTSSQQEQTTLIHEKLVDQHHTALSTANTMLISPSKDYVTPFKTDNSRNTTESTQGEDSENTEITQKIAAIKRHTSRQNLN
jgi:S1-C subfamily serine protease